MNRPPLTRRTVLGSAASVFTALAGCTDTSQQGESSNRFQDVAVEGEAVVITLTSSSEVDRVSLINPDGNRVGSTEIVDGETRITFELGTSYTPGTFDVVAEPDWETSIEIRPEVDIQEIGIGANHMERMPEGLGSMRAEEAYVHVKNNGNGPVELRDLMFDGDVPNPTVDLRKSDTRSGIFDSEDGDGETLSVTLIGGNVLTLFSTTAPFSFEGNGRDCKVTPYSGTFTTSLASSVHEEVIRFEFGIQYSGSTEYDGCSMTVEELAD